MRAARGSSLASAILSPRVKAFSRQHPDRRDSAVESRAVIPPKPPAAPALDRMGMIDNAHLFTGANRIGRVRLAVAEGS